MADKKGMVQIGAIVIAVHAPEDHRDTQDDAPADRLMALQKMLARHAVKAINEVLPPGWKVDADVR